MADTNGLAPSKDLHKQLNLVWSVQGHQAMWCDVVWVQMSFLLCTCKKFLLCWPTHRGAECTHEEFLSCTYREFLGSTMGSTQVTSMYLI